MVVQQRFDKIRKLFPTTLALSLSAWLFGLYTTYTSETSEEIKTADLNDQRISENYLNAIKEIKYSVEYNGPAGGPDSYAGAIEGTEPELIRHFTAITLRELSVGSPRKSRIVLLNHKLKIPDSFSAVIQSSQQEKGAAQDAETFYRGADLRGVDFTGFDLKQADLSKADLRGSVFTKGRLDGADLRNADLSCYAANEKGYAFGTDFGWLPFAASVFAEPRRSCSRLLQANFTGADLRKTSFQGASLEGAILAAADLREADLRDTQLDGVTWDGADIHCADFRGSGLQRDHFESLNRNLLQQSAQAGQDPRQKPVRNIETAVFDSGPVPPACCKPDQERGLACPDTLAT